MELLLHAVIKSGARIGAVGENKFEIKKNVEYKVRIKTVPKEKINR